MIGEPQMLHTDNGKEFVNELLTNWLEKRNIKHILGGNIIHKIKEQLKILTKLFKNSYIRHIQTVCFMKMKNGQWFPSLLQ